MASKGAKGNQFQNWCVNWMKSMSPESIIHNQKAVAKQIPIGGQMRWISQRNDIFGCIDIIWIPTKVDFWTFNILNRPIAFIQCTMSHATASKMRELADLNWPLDACAVQLWRKIEPGKIMIYSLCPDGRFVIKGEIIRGVWEPAKSAVYVEVRKSVRKKAESKSDPEF